MVSLTHLREKLGPVIIIIILVAALAGMGIYVCRNHLTKSSPIVSLGEDKTISKEQYYSAMYFSIGPETMDMLIETRLIKSEGKRMGMEVTEEEVNRELANIINSQYLGYEDYFKDYLSERRFSLQDYIDTFVLPLIIIRKIVICEAGFTETEQRKFFHDNIALFHQAEVKRIIVEDLNLAEDIIDKLNSGEEFSSLAKRYSVDAISVKDNGGYIGLIKRGCLEEPIEEVIFDHIGLYPEPVRADSFYWVLEVIDNNVDTLTFDDVSDTIPELMINQELIDTKISELWAKANIKKY